MNPVWKILHTESHRQWGGQERRIFNESRWMRMNGHRIVIVAPKPSPLYDRARRQGWETHALPFKKSGMIRDALRLRTLLRRVRPDVLNTHGNTDSKVGLAAAWGLKIPCVIRTRHSTPAVGNSWYNRLLYRDLCHYVFTTASCITRQLNRDLRVPANRIKTLPSGIDCPGEMIDRESARKRLADEIGVGGGQRFVGFIGRLSAEKGLPVLIDAFDAIKDRLPDHHLVIIGDGDLVAELQARIASKGRQACIHLLGYRDDPWPYFRALDCFVLASSRYEGVPQAMLQAMFAECPVVGTKAGGIPDIVSHGRTGLLVPPDDPRLLAEAILHTIESPAATTQRVASAYRYAKDNHTLEKMGRRILRIYARRLSK
jgi:glycosyltransferase involved in cell wall biosynthesis